MRREGDLYSETRHIITLLSSCVIFCMNRHRDIAHGELAFEEVLVQIKIIFIDRLRFLGYFTTINGRSSFALDNE